MNKMTVRDVNLKGKKVIVRVDFNVPLDKSLNITDDRRIKEALPTIKYILEQGGRAILMSHLGRPDGKVVDSLRLNPIAKKLESLLKEKILKLDDCVGEEIAKKVKNSSEKVILLENLRFHKEEEANDPNFAKQLASLADIYVNDAFGTAHRAHASTAGIAKNLPAVAGFLIEKEIKYLGQAVQNPQKPFVMILGGAKVSDKIQLIENMLPKVNAIIIGGAMAYTFLKSQGKNVGNSKLEKDKIGLAGEILEKAKKKGVQIALTSDYVIVQGFDKQDTVKIAKEIPDGWESIDIGPETRKQFNAILAKAKTIVWNGPLGVFEIDAYAKGTKEVAEFVGSLKGVTSIIGGGDSAAAISKFGLDDKFTHISTGGGASLEYLEGKELPGIAVLNDKKTTVKV